MTSKTSAFVVPSERFTLRFDPSTVEPSGFDRPRRGRRRGRLTVGLTTSAAVVLLAVVATTTQASSSPSAHATADVAVAAAAPIAALAPVAPVAAVVAADDLYDRAASTCPGLPATV